MQVLEKIIQRDLFKIVSELKKCNNNSKYYDLVNDLDKLEEIIAYKNLDIKYPVEIEYESFKKDTSDVRRKSMKEFYDSYDNNYFINKKIVSMNKYFNDRYIETPKDFECNESISFEDTKKIVGDFFKKYDENIYNFYIQYINTSKLIVVDNMDSLYGYCTNSNYLLDEYILMTKDDLIMDSITLAHEIIHAYHFSKIKYANSKELTRLSYNNLFEVYSSFIENIMFDYLEINGFKIEDINFLRKAYDFELLSYLNKFELSFYDIDINFLENEVYTYGKILGYHYYDLYLKDSQKCKYFINKFMLDSKDYDRIYMLKNYGLNINDIINPQKIGRYIDKHLKRVKK